MFGLQKNALLSIANQTRGGDLILIEPVTVPYLGNCLRHEDNAVSFFTCLLNKK
jgi:hypothetical protein